MPFDGIVTKNIAKELNDTLVGGRIEKIFQPESDEIIINTRCAGKNLKLLLSASASYPRIHFTESSRENPAVPPVFCMLLRKHLAGGKVIDVLFHDFERIITLLIESVNELGDLSVKKLIIEIMGRHSNIILTNSEDKIIDSIKHVDNEISSVREVMPARPYVLPPAQNKANPETLELSALFAEIPDSPQTLVEKYLLEKIKGFSPMLCREVCLRANIEGKRSISGLSAEELERVESALERMIRTIRDSQFTPCIIYEDRTLQKPVDFHSLQLLQYENIRHFDSIGSALDEFYGAKDRLERLKQKKSDVLRVLTNSLDRCNKKLALQQDKLREVANREQLQLFGELITANIYCIPKNVKQVSLLNYYSETGEYVDIPLDETLSPQDNAQRYFKKYAKAKSTFTNTQQQLEESLRELDYLESVLALLDNCSLLQEIEEIRQELIEQGYMTSKRKSSTKKHNKTSLPLYFLSTQGYEIYVGKNNRQNDQLTLKTASSNDIWMHTKNIPGSHVILRKQQGDIPDQTLLEGAMLAAFHSKAKLSSNVEVDYTTVRNVKKPNGAKPGMVIYENYKTIVVNPDEKMVNQLAANVKNK